MTNKNKQGNRRHRAGGKEDDVLYLAKKLGMSERKARDLIASIGNDRVLLAWVSGRFPRAAATDAVEFRKAG